MRPMTSDEKNRLRLIVDGYDSLKKVTWALWAGLLAWRIFLWATGPGSVGDMTLFALMVVIPIGVAGFAASASKRHRKALKGGVVAGVSEQIDEIGEDFLIVRGEHFSVPGHIGKQLEVGEMVAVEFAPSTRMVLSIHRIQGDGPPKQLQAEATNRSAVVTD